MIAIPLAKTLTRTVLGLYSVSGRFSYIRLLHSELKDLTHRLESP